MIGKTLSHYKVLEKIGQGGMGEVYRAEDTNLSREVAIKVLPEQFTQDPQRLARFEREAKLLASLNHPNIAAIYGFEEADDVRFLAMELVPGETLAERVAKGPVPVEEALEVCRQIAEGVEAAHEKGVIHRDLKPANVKVTPEGKVKILDFGLAKAFEAEVPVTDISQSPTLTEEMTRAGVILGTAAYMSPEQAKGEAVDKRADIFAFGCVLYELLTGKRTFSGKTITETLGAIIHKEPDWKALPNTTPWRIQELLRRCLTKDARDRLRHIATVRIEVKLALYEPTAESPTGAASAVQPRRRLWAMALGLVVLGAVVAGLAVWLLIQPSSPEQTSNRFVITPSPPARLTNGNGREVAISPDGEHLVYQANAGGENRLYLRSLNDFVDRAIPGTEGAHTMFFSPDSESMAFHTQGLLKKISLTGGSPITVCQAPTTWTSGAWGPDDTIIFNIGNSLHRVSASGGEPEPLVALNRDVTEVAHLSPQFLPGGESILYTLVVEGGTQYHLKTMSLETGEQRTVLENARQAQYLTTGHLIYEQPVTGSLMVVPFDPIGIEVTGDPVPVVQQVRYALTGAADFTISENGTLVYVPGGGPAAHKHRLVWVDLDGTETLVTQEEKDYRAPRISPDGKLVSLAIGDPASNQVWIYDLEAESISRFSFKEPRNGSQAWSPDGKWLVFQSGGLQEGGGVEGGMVRQPTDRSLPQERLTSTRDYAGRQMPNSWSSDGKFLAFTETSNNRLTGTFDIGILSMEGDGEPEYIVASPALECCPKFSPDGKWLAYVSNESGLNQVYVRPFPEPDVKWLISDEDEGGGQPVWSPDGKELFYRSGNKAMAVSIQTQSQTLTAGSPRVLFEGQYVSHSVPLGFQYWDISPDGKRFLMSKESTQEQEQSQINVVLNWFEELKRLVPTT